MANAWIDLIGTQLSSFMIGLGTTGIRLKNTAGNLVLRNKADTSDINITAGQVRANADSILINADAAGTGADRSLTISKNTAATANLEIQAPPAKGTDGFVLRQKAGTAAGVLELELAAPTTGSATVDTTTIAFGATSPVTLFTLPTGAIIDSIMIIIDTAFTGTPSLSIGISGTTSKYVSSTQIDLTEPSGTAFRVFPNLPAPAADESLIATYAAGSATAGSARVIITYATPV